MVLGTRMGRSSAIVMRTMKVRGAIEYADGGSTLLFEEVCALARFA